MRFVLEFDLYDGNGHTDNLHEILRVLGKVSDQVYRDGNGSLDFGSSIKTHTVLNINGNRIGGWKVTDDD